MEPDPWPGPVARTRGPDPWPGPVARTRGPDPWPGPVARTPYTRRVSLNMCMLDGMYMSSDM